MMVKSISFVLPMYNESESISNTIDHLKKFASGIAKDYEIIVTDDASTDGSGDIVDREASFDIHVRSIRLKANTKFGGALAAGLAAAGKDIVLYTDSDLPAKDEDMLGAINMLSECDVVTAYSKAIKDPSLKRIIMSKVYNFLVKLLFNFKLKDINSGLKVYKHEVLQGLKLISRSPFVDVEIFAEAIRRGYRIGQYGLIFEQRQKGKSTISRFDVVGRTFWDMLMYRLKG